MNKKLVATLPLAGLLVCATVVAVSLAWLPRPASSETRFDYVDCRFFPAEGKLWVRVNDEEGLIRRRGRRIEVLEPVGGRYVVLNCGRQATVGNTDLIRFDIRSIGATDGRLSLAGGPFAPGRTRGEDEEVPEIDIVASVDGFGDMLRVEGTNDATASAEECCRTARGSI